jgi:HPt (histidine-containing phosphotransfer) domain-containing protein
MDGVETVKKIRALGGKFENLVIVALTANAVSGAREMFLENGFNDFISKPINADELQQIVLKYLPPNKINKAVVTKTQQADVLNKEEQLRKKSIITFVKENRQTFENITVALANGDTSLVHRIAHTLKSSAGYLGKKELQEAAFSLEKSLHEQPPVYMPEQLALLEAKLNEALADFEPVVAEAESDETETVQLDNAELTVLLAELKPLLENSDYAASEYVEKLQGVAGMEDLAQLIDEYDFNGALEVLLGKM